MNVPAPRAYRRFPWTGFAIGLLLGLGSMAFRPTDHASWALPDEAESALATVTPADIEATVRFLASDDLQGRGTGHVGNDRAAGFLATAFERAGLVAPVPGFRQPVALLHARLGERNGLRVESTGSTRGEVFRAPGDEFHPVPGSPSREVAGGLAFAGFGLTTEDGTLDDFAGLDVRGSLVVVFDGAPVYARRAQGPLSRLGDIEVKAKAAGARGALALLVMPDPTRRGSRQAGETWRNAGSVRAARYLLADGVLPIPVVRVSIQTALRALGTDAEGRQLTESRLYDSRVAGRARSSSAAPRPFPARGRRAALSVDVRHAPATVVNVIGALPGTDTRLEGAPIVVCAHLDHDGVDATRQIYNGADDNASGAAAVVEIAGAFARAAELGRRPRRPVVFALWNAEEKGLLGSRYYVEHPEPAGSRPAAVLNLDMIGRSEEIPDRPDPRFRGLTRSRAVDNADALHLLGYTFSPDLAKLADEENRDIGLRIRKQYDHHPIDLLRRSDHWPFLLERIPALFVTTGLHPDYHTPQDDADRIDFAKVARIARLVYRVTWRLADADDAPAFVAPVGVSEP